MNTRISDAAVEAAWQEYEKLAEWGDALGADAERACMRAALEAALPHLQPAKPVAVRLRDELRERKAFEAWARPLGYRTVTLGGYYQREPTHLAWNVWQAALASVQPSTTDVPQLDSGLYQWLKERDLLPDAGEDGGIDMDAVIQALTEHERMLGEVQPSPAGQGDALAMPVCKPRAMADDLPGYYESDRDWMADRDNAAALTWFIDNSEAIRAAIAARQPVGQEPVAHRLITGDPKRKWMAIQGAPSLGVQRQAEEYGWEIELLYSGKPAQAVDLGHVIDQIAQQWDGCSYDAVGETIDVGQAIRAAAKRLIDSSKAVQS